MLWKTQKSEKGDNHDFTVYKREITIATLNVKNELKIKNEQSKTYSLFLYGENIKIKP